MSSSQENQAERVCHPYQPVFDGQSRILILGTMASPASRSSGFYYGHKQNRFWKVLAAIFSTPLPQSNEEKRAFILEHHLALYDVLSACTITGASDASIRDPKIADLSVILAGAPIERILCNGQTTGKLFKKYDRELLSMDWRILPSTSPANAAKSLSDLIEIWKPAFDLLTDSEEQQEQT